jgi:hypothetical protein
MRLPPRGCAVAFAVLSTLFISGARRADAAGAGPDAMAEEEEEEWEEEEEGEDEGEASAGKEADAGKDGEKGRTSVESKDGAFDRLVEANGPLIFGGKVKVLGDRFEVLFDGDGQVKAGFEGKGIHDSKSEDMKGANRKFIRLKDKKDKEEEQLIPGLTAIGIGEGTWLSRFPVAGEPWVEMGFRIPNLIGKESNVRIRVNWKKKTGYETNFFKSISYVSDGTVKGTNVTPIKEYQGTPNTWFPRKGKSVKVEFGVRDGRMISRIDARDVVMLQKPIDRGGHIGITFSKLLFTIDNLKVSGKLDRAWCEKEIEKLRAAGKLRTGAPGSGGADPEAGGPAGG